MTARHPSPERDNVIDVSGRRLHDPRGHLGLDRGKPLLFIGSPAASPRQITGTRSSECGLDEDLTTLSRTTIRSSVTRARLPPSHAAEGYRATCRAAAVKLPPVS